jgi:hypothetical protein
VNEPLWAPARLWLAFVCFFRILFDGTFAGSSRRLLAPANDLEPIWQEATIKSPHESDRDDRATARDDGALALLALFQREGRLVDFLQQDIEAFPDADVGAAARVVHGGSGRALRSHFDVNRIRNEPEGTRITVDKDDGGQVRLTGNVRGSAPYQGILRHSGWRVGAVRLPDHVDNYDSHVVAPAEVEL